MAMDSMNKVIHAAVRRDLARLGGALDEVTDGDRRRATDLCRAWRNLRDQLRHHHEQEDTILFPVVVHLGIDPALVEALEAEHRAMSAAMDEVDTAMSSYSTSASAADAADAADAVRRGTGVVDHHLAHEEGELEPLVREHLESAEWKAAMRQLRKQPPRKVGWFFAWLDDGASDEARAYVASEVPAPVRFVFGRVFGRGYRRTVAPTWGQVY
jgi:hemerythrin-like domain-containing protein